MEPKLETLQEAIVYFSNPANCRDYVVARRWPNGVECPRCGSRSVKFLENYNRWQCGRRHANRQFTAKTGTIFEDSPLGLDKWLSAMWQVVNCRNGVSSYEVHRAIRVTQKTAWFMDHRIRFALQSGSITKLGGGGAPVEVDETFIGGKARNMHKSKRERLSRDGGMQGGSGKAVVMGLLERGGKVKTAVIPHRKHNIPEKIVRELVEPGAEVHTDEFMGYNNLKDGYIHKVVNHLEGYVKENVQTNEFEKRPGVS